MHAHIPAPARSQRQSLTRGCFSLACPIRNIKFLGDGDFQVVIQTSAKESRPTLLRTPRRDMQDSKVTLSAMYNEAQKNSKRSPDLGPLSWNVRKPVFYTTSLKPPCAQIFAAQCLHANIFGEEEEVRMGLQQPQRTC
jgi:hypothetical protein